MAYKDIRIEIVNDVEVLKATSEETITQDVSINKSQVEERIAELTAELAKFQNLLGRFS